MVALARGGRVLAITPDGPRGPFEAVQPGLLVTAQRSGAMILPIGVAAHPSTRLGSWDAFLVPHPGARLVLSMAKPVELPADLATGDLVERLTGPMEAYLKANDDHAHRQLLRWVAGSGPLAPYEEPFGHAARL
jgi:lysophospholipid acyltransferase (LPLAT)-like uncharacterized protein